MRISSFLGYLPKYSRTSECALRRPQQRDWWMTPPCPARGRPSAFPASPARRATGPPSAVQAPVAPSASLASRADCCCFAQTGAPPGSPATARSQDGLAGHPGRPARCSEMTARFVHRTALRSSSTACDVLEARWRPPTPAPRRRRSSARPRQIVAGAWNPAQAVSDGLQLLDVEEEGLGLPELEVHEVRRHHLRSLGAT